MQENPPPLPLTHSGASILIPHSLNRSWQTCLVFSSSLCTFVGCTISRLLSFFPAHLVCRTWQGRKGQRKNKSLKEGKDLFAMNCGREIVCQLLRWFHPQCIVSFVQKLFNSKSNICKFTMSTPIPLPLSLYFCTCSPKNWFYCVFLILNLATRTLFYFKDGTKRDHLKSPWLKLLFDSSWISLRVE